MQARLTCLLFMAASCTAVIPNGSDGANGRGSDGADERGPHDDRPSQGGSGGDGAGTGGARVPTEASFECGGPPQGTPTPRRLWRLSPRQYVNTVAVAITGRRPTDTAPLTAPADLKSPLDPLGDVYRFNTYSGSHGLTGFEVGKSMVESEELARKIVGGVRTGTCWATATAGAAQDACIETLLQERGSVLFRRPLSSEELARYGGYVKTNAAAFGRDEALGLAFQAMLIAPQFLFLAELGAPVASERGVARLGGYEIAAAISYGLTDGPADATLWEAARTAALATPEQIRAHVSRILGSKAATTTGELIAQYFKLDRVLTTAKSIEKSGEYGRQRVYQDARQFIDRVLATNGRKDFLGTLLTTRIAFAGADSYKLYGLGSAPSGTEPVMLPASERAGILTQPAFLASFAGLEETLPIKRGRFISESLLCREVPEAPLDVVTKLPASMSTVREKLAVHSSNPRCAACHALLDPGGLALERYDAYGRYRSTEHGKPIDASGAWSGVAPDVDGRFEDAVDLAGRLAKSKTVEQCFLRHTFRYYMGRPEEGYDGCALKSALDAFEAGPGDLAAAITALFASPSFLNRSL